MADEYTCARCGETNEKGWSDDEAEAEYKQNFPDEAEAEVSRALICDDCYKRMFYL